MVANLVAALFFIMLILTLAGVAWIEIRENKRNKAQQVARLRELEKGLVEAEKIWPIDDVGL